MAIALEIVDARAELIDADALLVPVDGQLCKLVRSIAATLIGTAYRMPADLAVRAFVDGVAAARDVRTLIVRWSLPDAGHRVLADAAARRLGLAR